MNPNRHSIRLKNYDYSQACAYFMPIWQRNYYEHIIRYDESLQQIRKYIVQNTEKLGKNREITTYLQMNRNNI